MSTTTYPAGKGKYGGVFMQTSFNSFNANGSNVITCMTIYNTTTMHFSDLQCYDGYAVKTIDDLCFFSDQSAIHFQESFTNLDTIVGGLEAHLTVHYQRNYTSLLQPSGDNTCNYNGATL